MKSEKYSIRVRVWIDSMDGPLLGSGRVLLLEKIGETGSITNAARALKMSYRQAWQLVEEMNQRSASILVEKKLGGKGGGGARLTDSGRKAINLFHSLNENIQRFVNTESSRLQL